VTARTGLAQEVVVVSDLHLGAWAPEVTAPHEQALGRLLAHLLADPHAAGPRLVLLGDTLDFAALRPGRDRRPDTSTAASLAILDRLAASHPAFVGAIAGWLDGGGVLDIVVGNHDVDLARPRVQQELWRVLGLRHSQEGRARVHPWVFHLAGVLHAEHGHQHHDVNAVATPACPWGGRDGGLQLPLAAHLDRSRAGLLAAATAHALSLVGPARAARRAAYRRRVLPPLAAETGLDASTLIALDRLSRATPWSMAARLAGVGLRSRRAGGPATPTQRDGYLHRAARRVHGTLAARGAAVPFYAYGHTHVAERFPLWDGPGAPVYVNAGTWSPAVPRGSQPGAGATYLRVLVPRGDDPVAGVWRWDDAAGRAEPA
jgi:hypothetical protein